MQDWCILSTYRIIAYIFHDYTVDDVHLKVLTIHTHIHTHTREVLTFIDHFTATSALPVVR
jgi:hypothetical protein